MRVLGITSRYTTVLQHSMTELQAAANAAGADMRIAIEPDDHSLENPFLDEILSFKPDLLVQISRLRHENPHLPRNIPFLCWDQDNLPCMRTPQAGASLDALTFIAGHAALHGFCHLHWPRRNLIFCHPAGATFRYSAEPISRDLLAQHACDISFISNAAGSPQQMRDQLALQWRQDPLATALFHDAAAEILTRMDQGTTWEFHSLRRLIAGIAMTRGIRFTGTAEREMIMALTTFADRCFRHAALRWVSRWCREENRSFRIYGHGWDQHPDFAPFAAGYAAQGESLRAICQASRINLHLMESGGFLHSRTLDGIAAGGFFLTRLSPNDGADAQRVHAQNILGARAADLHLKTRRDLETCTDPEVQSAWSHMRQFFTDLKPEDPVAGLAIWKDLPAAFAKFPHLPQITFSSESEFTTLARQYLADDALRQNVSSEMRDIILREMSFSSRWSQFQAAIVRGLSAPRPAEGAAA